jgi:predicted O-methyltransferase YrrM
VTENAAPRQIVLPAIQSAVTAEEAAALAALARGKTVLEMGAWHGYSTVVLGSVAEHVISVDWHHGDYHAGLQDTEVIFRANLDRYGVADRVRVIVDRFEKAIPELAAEGVTVDMAFIDARHDSPSVQHDLGLALTIVKPGGCVAFHDYGRNASNGHPGFGVTEVADAFGISGSAGFLGWGFVPES